MSRMPIHELRKMGVSQEDIEMAQETQRAQRRNGSPVLSIGVLCGVQDRRSKSTTPTNINTKALRKGGVYDQAALLLNQQALNERDPERAILARNAAAAAKELSQSHQLEFNFFGGNVSLAYQYQDAINERLRSSGRTLSQQQRAKSVLWDIVRHLGWQNYECQKSAADLCEITQIKPPHMADTLKLLEEVGAIKRVKIGRTKKITVTPEGAYRGEIVNHAQTVERYKLGVINGGKADE